jgi:hypothetical protein
MFFAHLDDMLELAVQHQAEIRAQVERDALASDGRADRRRWHLPSLKGLWSAIATQLTEDVMWPRLRDYPYRR